MGSGSFHKGLSCGLIFYQAKDDDEAGEPVDYFCSSTSFFSFLIVFSISGLNSSGVPVRENLGIKNISNTVSLTKTPIC